MRLKWIKCQSDVWCKLNFVNLNHDHFNNRRGIYIIWHGGSEPAVVYVGQGNIKDRIVQHRDNQQIQRYAHLDLYVTWATVSAEYRDGVERYLADNWDPKVGAAHPIADPIEVNSPWD